MSALLGDDDPMRLAMQGALAAFAPPPDPWPTPLTLGAALDPGTVRTPALELIDAELVRLAAAPTQARLMVFMSPQEGKSTLVSHRFVTWYLRRNPEHRVAIVSHNDDLARGWGAAIKADVEAFDGSDGTPDLGITLRADARAAGRWGLEGHRGGVYCVSVGGSLTGRPVDLLCLDDPIKDLEEAQSLRYRDRARRFWQGVAVPRMAPRTKTVLVQTRWHEDDLGGWLLRTDLMRRWRVVSIPAIAESDTDPLGRAPGEPMVSARGDRDFAAIRAEVGEYAFAAMYQQRPAPAEGGIFRRAALRHWGYAADGQVLLGDRGVNVLDCWRFLTVDLAASTRTSADYTAVGVWGVTPDGDLLLLDGARERVEESRHFGLVRGLRERWSADVVFVESRMFGTTLVYEAGRAGLPIVELRAETDKTTRALPAAARADSGRLWLPPAPEHPWVEDWVGELTSFPNAVHDDVVDVVAYAARVVAAHWLPPQRAEQVLAQREASRALAGSAVAESVYVSSTGLSPGGVDLMRAPM